MENTGYWFLWMSPEEAEKHWAKPRKTKRTHSQSAATDVKPKWTRLSISCCFTCQAAALLNTDGGWLVRPIPLQLNDGPTASCPSGGKTLFEEEGSPWALLSLKLAENNPSNLVTSSANHNHSPPTPCSTSPSSNCRGRLKQDSEAQLPCSQFILPMFFPACHGSLCTSPALEENLLPHCCFLEAQGRGFDLAWPRRGTGVRMNVFQHNML